MHRTTYPARASCIPLPLVVLLNAAVKTAEALSGTTSVTTSLRMMPGRHRFSVKQTGSREICATPAQFVRHFAECSNISFALNCFSPPVQNLPVQMKYFLWICAD
jgi:hypothetical protein